MAQICGERKRSGIGVRKAQFLFPISLLYLPSNLTDDHHHQKFIPILSRRIVCVYQKQLYNFCRSHLWMYCFEFRRKAIWNEVCHFYKSIMDFGERDLLGWKFQYNATTHNLSFLLTHFKNETLYNAATNTKRSSFSFYLVKNFVWKHTFFLIPQQY